MHGNNMSYTNSNNEGVRVRKIIFIALIYAILIATPNLARIVLSNGVPIVKLAPTNSIISSLPQSPGLPESGKSIAVAGQNYSLQDIHYFDNQAWVVANILPAKGSANKATVILRRISGTYSVALGPGTAFSGTDVQDLPSGVVSYLQNQNLIHGTSYGL